MRIDSWFDHVTNIIKDNVFCGDSIFHADIGTARCDFPGGSADHLYHSGRRLLSLPDHVKIWTGHDYPPAPPSTEKAAATHEGVDHDFPPPRLGAEREMPPRPPTSCMTVREHRQQNRHLKDGISRDEFVLMRTERDSSLGAPRLLHQSLQVNIRAGRLPKPNDVGFRLLHVPMRLGDLGW